ncbi:retrovirus-related Pol polyprotein from type-1 retrotransposable element R1 [Trichonephila clavipes]|nr:retrovirus-related Pol polyprotein from type-1 retrotransposable element R1 [Trichonephila clavipes]
MLINAKSESWKKFLLTIDAQNVWKKVYTYGVKKRIHEKSEITGIKLPTGETTTSLDETINAVLQKSLPSDSEEKDNIFQKDYRHVARTAYPSFFDPSFSYDEVNTMVSMLKLNKSPGRDSFSNEIIKQFHLAFPSFLHKLFNVCLGLGIFPRIWKLAQVILIPKVNEFRVPHLDNLRISWYLRRGDFLSSDQYAFTPHKSTEDALLRLNEIVKRGKKKHLHSILISLDIKGAFDNAWWPCILNLLKKAEIPINIFSLVADFLNDRLAKMQLGSTSAIRCLERGCPQGSVSGPIFWNIIINDLLSKLNKLACCEIIAFADDILVCSQGRDIFETLLHAQEALNFASDWSKSFKLEFNPDKTRFMAIEKRNVCYDAFQLYLYGTPLTMVKQMKYLGVLLDTKFSWKQHLSYISEKCDKLQRGLNRIARNTFGINFNVHSLIYKQGIEPFILYGSRVWGEALKRKMNSKYLRRIQRRILLRVLCGYRTISYETVYAISGFPPIDITILHNVAFRENLSASSISNYDCILSPFLIPHPSERNAINTVQFSDKSTEDFPVICYTDGSKIDGRVGFAFVVFRSGVESENFQFRIRDECTVFVAELLCLNFAVKWITEQNSVISEYLICTDSLSSLDSLKCISSPNNIIVEIQRQLKSLRDKNISIDFAFVRGHTGVLENERADWLAKAATKRKIDIDVNIPKSFYKKITNEKMMKSWNQEYLISNKGSITKKFFPTINKRLSCHHFYTNYKLTQFLTGHGNFKSYLNKFNFVSSSFCDCNIGGEENVEHVILLCSKYVRERKIIRLAFNRLNINWPPNFHQFLSTRSAFKNFCKFVATVCNPS